MRVGAAVGAHHVRAELLEPFLARITRAVGVDDAADTHEIAALEPGYARAHLRDASDDFMPRHAGVVRGHDGSPLVPREVNVGMADATEEDVDLNVAIQRVPPRDGGRPEPRSGARSRKGFGVEHASRLATSRVKARADHANVRADRASSAGLAVQVGFSLRCVLGRATVGSAMTPATTAIAHEARLA